MSGTRAVYGNRSGRGGALGAFFRAWVADVDNTPIAGRVQDKVIGGMQVARAVVGLVAAVWLVVAYPLSSGGQEFVLGKLVELGFSCGILAVGCVIGITAFLVASTPDRRRDFAERLRGPIMAVVMLLSGPFCIWLSLKTLQGELITAQDMGAFFDATIGRGVIAGVLGFLILVIGWLAAIALLICSIPFTLLAAYACVFTCLRASDVHQLLPALLSPLLVWSLFAFQLFSGPDVAAPAEVLYTFMLGGPLSVTALSVWEVRRLRSHHGITLRGALGR
ncbi:hypothetical protein [Streptomyces sp. NBC_01244]|uniref:hypothetical protein n=1 Tax=Streptomyces sp. NBC_01244 TaxID=2903797 RepID=UPI002E1213E3|nr:hypothetical protein OG247_01900 [Streptomyces sp. NBC_01244]